MPSFNNGDSVLVAELTRQGRERLQWSGKVADRRDNVKGLGSIEYLIMPDDGTKGKWVAAQFLIKR